MPLSIYEQIESWKQQRQKEQDRKLEPFWEMAEKGHQLKIQEEANLKTLGLINLLRHQSGLPEISPEQAKEYGYQNLYDRTKIEKQNKDIEYQATEMGIDLKQYKNEPYPIKRQLIADYKGKKIKQDRIDKLQTKYGEIVVEEGTDLDVLEYELGQKRLKKLGRNKLIEEAELLKIEVQDSDDDSAIRKKIASAKLGGNLGLTQKDIQYYQFALQEGINVVPNNPIATIDRVKDYMDMKKKIAKLQTKSPKPEIANQKRYFDKNYIEDGGEIFKKVEAKEYEDAKEKANKTTGFLNVNRTKSSIEKSKESFLNYKKIGDQYYKKADMESIVAYPSGGDYKTIALQELVTNINASEREIQELKKQMEDMKSDTTVNKEQPEKTNQETRFDENQQMRWGENKQTTTVKQLIDYYIQAKPEYKNKPRKEIWEIIKANYGQP